MPTSWPPASISGIPPSRNREYILVMRHCPRIAATGALLALAVLRSGAQDAPDNPPVAPFNNVFVSLGNAFSNVDLLNVRFDSARYDAIAGHGFSIGGGKCVA